MQMFTATTIHLFKMLNHFFTPVSSFFILFWQMQSTKMQQVPDTIFTSGLIVDYLLACAPVNGHVPTILLVYKYFLLCCFAYNHTIFERLSYPSFASSLYLLLVHQPHLLRNK